MTQPFVTILWNIIILYLLLGMVDLVHQLISFWSTCTSVLTLTKFITGGSFLKHLLWLKCWIFYPLNSLRPLSVNNVQRRFFCMNSRYLLFCWEFIVCSTAKMRRKVLNFRSTLQQAFLLHLPPILASVGKRPEVQYFLRVPRIKKAPSIFTLKML